MWDTEDVHRKNVNMACDLQGFIKQLVRKVQKRARTYETTCMRTSQLKALSHFYLQHIIVWIVLYLHCTSNTTIFEVSFPTSLRATHRYPPLSFLFTSVIVRSELFADK